MEPQQTDRDPARDHSGQDREVQPRTEASSGEGRGGRADDPRTPTATAPDIVDRSVPTAEHAGQVGPDAADPPRAAGKSEAESEPDPELDPDEGADVFATGGPAKRADRANDAQRQDEDHISIDPPD